MKVGDKVMVRDNWIEHDYQIMQGMIIDIAYRENSSIPRVYLVMFDHKSSWFNEAALKTE